MKGMAISKITFFSYMIFFFQGIHNNIGGVAMIDIAKTFDVDKYVIGYIFTLMTVGGTLATLLGGSLVKKVPGRILSVAAVLCSGAGYFGVIFGNNIVVYSLSVFVAGMGISMLVYLANYFIVNLYEGKYRTVQLNALNFFFSFGAVVSPIVGGIMLKEQMSWENIYKLAMMILIPLLIMAVVLKFEAPKSSVPVERSVEKEPWTINVYFIGAAFLFYALAEIIFTSWIVVYLREVLLVDVAVAGMALSIFWTFMAIGRFVSGMVAAVVKVEKFILSLILVAFSSYIAVLSMREVSSILILIALMGLGFSGLYASLLSYGMMQLRYPSAKLMTFYLTVSSLGGFLCYLISSFVVQEFGLFICLSASAASMAVVGILIRTCIFLAGRHKSDPFVRQPLI